MDRRLMKFKLLATFTLAICSASLFASNTQSKLRAEFHRAAENINQFSNLELINNSLYEQIRPRANVTNRELTSEQINQLVRKYISEKYAPALIKSYSHIYSKLKGAKKDFSSCEKLEPIKHDEEILSSLCLEEQNDTYKVQYLTNGYSQGWKKTAVYIFNYTGGAFELVSIELQLNEGTKAYVEGI